jgi:NADPH-dependent glutamate synthase beta subunit-like oxidoreductase/CO/xanthine dehydrogenase FAD-binding subunit
MTLGGFEHIAASSVEEALAAYSGSERGTIVYSAGGTDLLGLLKDRVHRDYPRRVVGLKSIPGLDRIREEGGALKVGALATIAAIAGSEVVRERHPLLAEAARAVASPQLRNMGTLGGNLCQEPRCWYYRYPEDRFHCLRKGGTECAALAGENRFHSVFGAARVGRPACSDECPAGVEIPLYLAELRRATADADAGAGAGAKGDYSAASRLLLRINPMPAVTGRVCPHYCERACNRGSLDEAVSIRSIERGLGDYVLEHADALYDMAAAPTGKKVAIVGSGPAGLAAAFYLRRAGHEVRVFDRLPEAGGMLRYSIPAYRLPTAVLASLIASYERAGVAFELGVEVGGSGLSIAGLRARHDAVFLGTGAWGRRGLGLEGEELLEQGIDFLAGLRRGEAPVLDGEILVVGGGNVAVDVAISARRLGARRVTMACLESRKEMPAFPEEIVAALREGVVILPSWGPKRVIADGGGLRGLEFVGCSSVFDAAGRFAPTFDEERRMVAAADRVILAIGQAAELGYLDGAARVERGRIEVDEASQSCGSAGLYAGGDAVTGPASVISAIAAGRRAAASIDAQLRSGSRSAGPAGQAGQAEASPRLHSMDPETFDLASRAAPRERPEPERCLDAEDALTLDAAAIAAEARRCMDCGCVAVNASDLAPALVALGAALRTTKRRIEAEDFFAAREGRTTCLDAGELLLELEVPEQQTGSRFAFRKFRIRASIDFPIVSVAAALVVDGGRITRARVALGAVAPLPLRALEVEAFLLGKAPGPETAEGAAALASTGAFPLGRNGYKLRMLQALVREALSAC